MAIQTDVMVVLEDRPGLVARVGEALGAAGINIEGVCALASRGEGLIHILVEDSDGDHRQTQQPQAEADGELVDADAQPQPDDGRATRTCAEGAAVEVVTLTKNEHADTDEHGNGEIVGRAP